jgi:hypothetical protein
MTSRVLLTLGIVLCVATSFAKEQPSSAVAMKLEAFKDGFRLCHRFGPTGITGYWEVAQTEVERVDRALLVHLERSGLQKKLGVSPSLSRRQYLGLVSHRRRIIYINSFPNSFGGGRIDPTRQFVEDCEGGNRFWGIEYDPQKDSFLNLRAHATECKVPLELRL